VAFLLPLVYNPPSVVAGVLGHDVDEPAVYM
jgi:hypothetical protein